MRMLVLGAVVFFISQPVAGQSATSTLSHDGFVVDAISYSPIRADASAYEFGSDSPSGSDCPKFATKIFPKPSVYSNGRFIFDISGPTGDPPSYYRAVFCAFGYQPMTVSSIANKQNEPVLPYPVELFSLADSEKLGATVQQKLTTMVVNLRYLRSINPAAFDKALSEWSSAQPEKEIGSALLKLLSVQQ
jgi:hypothetical protein